MTPPVIGAPNKVATVTSVQTSTGRQLTINAVPNSANNTVSRIIQIPQNVSKENKKLIFETSNQFKKSLSKRNVKSKI